MRALKTPFPTPQAAGGGGIPTAGLLGEYLFESQDGTDTSGNSRDATNTNVTYSTGKIGSYCAVLNGSNAYIELPTLSAWEDLDSVDFSCCIWVETTDSTAGQSIVGNYATLTAGGPTPNQFWMLYNLSSAGDTAAFLRRDNNAETALTSGTVIKDGTWHFLIFEKDGLDVSIYKDNVLIDTDTLSLDGSTDNNQPVRVGVNFGRFLSANIDGLRLYNRVLTSDEKTLLFNE